MSRKLPKNRSEKPVSNRKASKIAIVAVSIVLTVIAGFLFFGSMRSNSTGQSNGTAVTKSATALEGGARKLSYEVVNSYPHDPMSFTQGFLWHDGGFFESTGQYGQSKLRRLEFPSGKVLKEISLAPDLFGEGLALVDSRLIQLTWKSHRGFVYDLSTFSRLQEFSYDTEGWGLTYDGNALILSDGSSDLSYFDPQTLKPFRKLAVRMNGHPVPELNELEFIEREIWANVWQTDLILRIDPSTGLVTSFLDLKGILAPSDKTGGENVLNGIAYDVEHKRVFVTGKLWPRIFEIRVKS